MRKEILEPKVEAHPGRRFQFFVDRKTAPAASVHMYQLNNGNLCLSSWSFGLPNQVSFYNRTLTFSDRVKALEAFRREVKRLMAGGADLVTRQDTVQ